MRLVQIGLGIELRLRQGVRRIELRFRPITEERLPEELVIGVISHTDPAWALPEYTPGRRLPPSFRPGPHTPTPQVHCHPLTDTPTLAYQRGYANTPQRWQ